MEDMRNYVQLGDRITYRSDNGVEGTMIVNSINFLPKPEDAKIIEIERPVYEVVKKVEVEEEKKELLTVEEKDYLKIITKITKDSRYLRLYKFIELDNKINICFYNDPDDGWILSIINNEFEFKGLNHGKCYSLEELGLGE